MGDGMPYQFEKGALLRIFEKHLNGGRDKLHALLGKLRESEKNNDMKWLVSGVPGLWDDPDFPSREPWTGATTLRRLMTDWFDYEEVTPGDWRPTQPKPNEKPKFTTGYWIGYRGDVATIVRRALLWAVELALHTGSDEAHQHPDPWPIELFWKCPENWFEAWVLSRRIPTTNTGLVTVMLTTPGHTGGEVAKSPIATRDKASMPGDKHPVPSYQFDYELLTFPIPLPQEFPESAKEHKQGVPANPRVKARERDYAMWVVTHRQHAILGEPSDQPEQEGDAERRVYQENTSGALKLGNDLEIPQLAEYVGTADVVVVAPSMPSGGITHDGKVI